MQKANDKMYIALGSKAAELVGLLEEKFADYLEKWVLQKKGLWWSADWQSGLGQVCPGYGTYVSNAQERAWRSIKGLFKKGFRHHDVSQLVRETAVTLQTLVRGGQYAKACFQIEEPPDSIAYSAKRLKSEQDDEGIQCHRLTLDLMQKWRDKEGGMCCPKRRCRC